MEAEQTAKFLPDMVDKWREMNIRSENEKRARLQKMGKHPRPKFALIESTGEVVIRFDQDTCESFPYIEKC